ncbi:MAG: DUF2779 domain-containing protein [Erysipelotrichaceae bacterium]|nr:DUF2779 domain-containing protein [Erysipelotrichaceae bacterium]
MIHISDIKKFNRCQKLYLLSKQNRELSNYFSFFNVTVSIEESIMKKLGISSAFMGVKNDPCARALNAMETEEWLVNARFEYEQLRIKVPFMHKVSEGWDLYFSCLLTNPVADDAATYAFYVTVLKRLGIIVHEVYLVHLNKDYIREEKLDDQQLWVVTNFFYNHNGNPSKHILTTIYGITTNMDEILEQMKEFDFDIDLPMEKTSKCTRRNKCAFYDECFPYVETEPDDSILHLSTSKNKFEMYQEGILRLQDVDLERIEGTRMQFAQIMAARNGGFFFDRLALKDWFSSIASQPAIFLDFEWDTYCIPPYHSMRPLQTLPFQYSIHILDGDTVEHKEYIGVGDCREDLLKHLQEDLPTKGNIFAYNAKGAEVLRLQELSMAFPAYAVTIQSWIDRMEDLSIPFEMGLVYDIRMRGMFSLKALNRMIHPEHTYQQLKVSHGLEAVQLHRALSTETDLDKVAEYRKALFEYCAMDTSELLAVYQWLQQKVEGN